VQSEGVPHCQHPFERQGLAPHSANFLVHPFHFGWGNRTQNSAFEIGTEFGGQSIQDPDHRIISLKISLITASSLWGNNE
jgi:hypothetical protein